MRGLSGVTAASTLVRLLGGSSSGALRFLSVSTSGSGLVALVALVFLVLDLDLELLPLVSAFSSLFDCFLSGSCFLASALAGLAFWLGFSFSSSCDLEVEPLPFDFFEGLAGFLAGGEEEAEGDDEEEELDELEELLLELEEDADEYEEEDSGSMP